MGTDVYSQPCQTSKMENFVKIVNGYKPLTIFAKPSILDVSQVSEYTSGIDGFLFKLRHE